MKKIFLAFILVSLLSIIFVPIFVRAAGLVTCSGSDCTIDSLVSMGAGIYNFIVNNIAAPLGTLAVAIAAILMMTSAGDPGRMATGKKILFVAVIGLALALGTKAIVNWILQAIGVSSTV